MGTKRYAWICQIFKLVARHYRRATTGAPLFLSEPSQSHPNRATDTDADDDTDPDANADADADTETNIETEADRPQEIQMDL